MKTNYVVYYLNGRGEHTDIVMHTATNTRQIADLALQEAATRLNPGLFALLLENGELTKVLRGCSA